MATGSGRGNDLAVLDAPALTTQAMAELLVGADTTVDGWIGAYFANYLQNDDTGRARWSEWIAAIDHIGPTLWRLFAAKLDTTLKERRVKRDSRLVWLPSSWLGILPLGLAQDPVSGRRLADDNEIVYAPQPGGTGGRQ